jgi:mRNA deadenylase 3'-5' endonuclease subunit Ccr4
VREVDEDGVTKLEMSYMFDSTMKSLIRPSTEPMAKSLTKIVDATTRKKGKKKKSKPPKPAAEDALAENVAAQVGSIEETLEFTVIDENGGEVNTLERLNIEGWTTGMILNFNSLKEPLKVVRDAPTVESIVTFPGELTRGNKLKSTGLMTGYPAIVQSTMRHADSVTYSWYHQAMAGDSSDYVHAGEGPLFVPRDEHVGLKIKVFATPVDSTREEATIEGGGGGGGGLCGRSAVSYIPGVVKEGAATTGILDYRAAFLALRGMEHVPSNCDTNKGCSEEDEVEVGKDFLSLFVTTDGELPPVCRDGSLTNASGYLKMGLPVRLHDQPLLCKNGEYNDTTGEHRQDDCMRVVSYNILADCYCGSEFAITHLFGYCDPAYLSLDYRLQLVGAELHAYDADIVCLQEVDKKAFLTFLSPFMKARGYSGHFTAKNTAVNEGEATFTKNDRFEVCFRVDLALGQSMKESGSFDQAFAKLPQVEEILVSYLGMIGQITVLAERGSSGCSRIVVVGNTHQFYHPDAGYIRLLQTHTIACCMASVASFCASRAPSGDLAGFTYPGAAVTECTTTVGGGGSGGDAASVSAIFLGDLNSTLETAVVEYLEKGVIARSHAIWAEVGGFDWHRERRTVASEDEKAEGAGHGEGEVEEGVGALPPPPSNAEEEKEKERDEAEGNKDHPWPELVCPLGPMLSAAGYPQFTNFTVGFKDVLDYIFVPRQGPYGALEPLRIAPMPSEQRLGRDGAIPSASFPSDHVALAVDLSYRKGR